MDDLVVGNLRIPGDDLEEIFITSGGPGGQHANRSETAVRLRFDVAASSLPPETKDRLIARSGPLIEVSASESRSQFRNRAIARQRLSKKISDALKPTRQRRQTKPTRASKRRRIADKRARGETKRLRRKPTADD